MTGCMPLLPTALCPNIPHHCSLASSKAPCYSLYAAHLSSHHQPSPVSTRALQWAARCAGLGQHRTGSQQATKPSSSSAISCQEHQRQNTTPQQSSASPANQGPRQGMVMNAIAHIPSNMPTVAQGSAAVNQCQETHLMASAAQPGAAADGNSSVKRRRTYWDSECPACSNRFSDGPRLMKHMNKCCPDLLPGAQHQHQHQQHSDNRLHLQQQFGLSSVADGQQSLVAGITTSSRYTLAGWLGAKTASDCSNDPALREVLLSAAVQEQALRMRVLQLQFVADPGGGVPAVDTSNTTAAAGEQVGDFESAEDGADVADIDSREDIGAFVPGVPEVSAAQQDRQQQQLLLLQESVGGGAMQHKQQPTSQRGRPVRQPLRPPHVIADILQLPHKRVLKLIQRAPRSICLVADPGPLHVVYEDAAFLAVLKPPGLRSAPVHRFMGGSALNRMIAYLGYEPHLLHRLDMNTSGVLVAAKDHSTASLAHAQFRDKTVSKAYLALALGVPQQQQFVVDGPIAAHPQVKVARRVAEGGLDAITQVQVLSTNPATQLLCPTTAAAVAAADPGEADQLQGSRSRLTSSGVLSHGGHCQRVEWGGVADSSSVATGACLVCCRPVTGRTHQIRVHMAHAGHPLLGDEVYGLQGPWIARQALHAWSLTLHHPGRDQPVTFRAPPPKDFANATAVLGLQLPPESAPGLVE